MNNATAIRKIKDASNQVARPTARMVDSQFDAFQKFCHERGWSASAGWGAAVELFLRAPLEQQLAGMNTADSELRNIQGVRTMRIAVMPLRLVQELKTNGRFWKGIGIGQRLLGAIVLFRQSTDAECMAAMRRMRSLN